MGHAKQVSRPEFIASGREEPKRRLAFEGGERGLHPRTQRDRGAALRRWRLGGRFG